MFATLRRMGLAAIAVLFVALGCSDPKVTEPEETSPFRDGDTLLSPTANVTITANGGRPWYIKEDYVIPEGVTVTVDAGAEIMVAGLNWIDVAGKIVAHGSSQSPIIFTSAHTSPDLGQWRGLKLHNPNEGSEFSYCIFTYGAFFDTDTLSERGRDAQNYKGMLAINNSSPTIRHCIVTNNQNNAIAIIHPNSRPVIEYNILTVNDASAVRADTSVRAINELQINYNCIADNSAPAFILANDTTDGTPGSHKVFGDPSRVNSNLDSCDSHFNIDLEPLFLDPAEDMTTKLANYGLQSCSPCVDAGPLDADFDPDGTPADMGAFPYDQAEFELRGRLEGNLVEATYRMSCDVVIPPGVTVTVPAGTRIEATGLFNMEIYGQLLVQGTAAKPVEICPCQSPTGDYVGGIKFFDRGDAPSVLQYMIVRRFNEVTVSKAGVRFENVEFNDGFLGGVEVVTGVTDPAQAVVFQSCSFINTGTQAIEVVSSSAVIRNTLINGSRGRGITLSNVGTGVEILNTVVEACSTTAISLTDFCSPTIVNNTITSSGYYGVQMANNCLPTMFNNIIISSGRFGVYAQFSSTPNVNYNDVWNNGLRDTSPTNYSPTNLGNAGNNLSVDPLFSGSDYRLQAGSQCVNGGMPDPAYNDTDGSRNDIGAWGGPGGGGVGSGIISGTFAHRF